MAYLPQLVIVISHDAELDSLDFSFICASLLLCLLLSLLLLIEMLSIVKYLAYCLWKVILVVCNLD